MNIHSLFILRESGICIYHRSYSNQLKDLQINLITPFFSAIFSFSQKVVSKKLEVLEMSDLRFVFKKEKGFIFTILSDSSQNLLFLNSRLQRVSELFFRNYDSIKSDIDVIAIENSQFDKLVDSLVYGEDEVSQIKRYGSYNKITNYFTDLGSDPEIMGVALLTNTGTLIYSSLTEELLLRAMRELEIRYMSGMFDLPEMFYTLGNGQKVCELIINYSNFINLLLIIHFSEDTPLGYASYMSETIVEKLKSLF